MEMCLKQEVIKYQSLHSRKRLKLKMADESQPEIWRRNFTSICSASTNFLSNYVPQFFFTPITVSVILHVFSLLIFLINFEKKVSPFTSNEHVVLCGFSTENRYKGICSYFSTTQNLKLYRRNHQQRFHKKVSCFKISKNLQKIKYIANSDAKKLVLYYLNAATQFY